MNLEYLDEERGFKVGLQNKKVVAMLSIFLLIGIIMTGTACSQGGQADSEKPTLVMADSGWDSIRFHNDVATIILEKGYGYKTEVKMGSTPISFTGVCMGDIDIYMETWTDNIGDKYPEAIENGDVIEVGVNFDDNKQGYYVPTYIIKGDAERGIKASAPDLKAVKDLPKYWEIFKDPEDKSKGRIYGAIPGWGADEVMTQRMESYGLSDTYNLFRPGSDTALSSSMVKAIEEGKPWVGYYWEPTWIMGKYDMTLLEEPAFDEEKWKNGYNCEFDSVRVTICVNKEMPKKAPEVVDFLKKYKTSSELTSEALAYMLENNVDSEETAVWFLKNNKDMWSQWVPEDIFKKVEAALN